MHSGQANAGHYYSYIKERRPPHVSGRQNHNKWFKFNDTSVDQFDMTDEALAAECFGGSFKANNAKDSKLPENRKDDCGTYLVTGWSNRITHLKLKHEACYYVYSVGVALLE